ncbi:hypothetical protein ABIB25_004973 [Nakamurella sp. UYEF19]|uniref:hypothetical protein n=1 Tax=Nakamurella sp. UYEF19 TaxID=1756392 RepID=UPI0033999A08
MNWLLQSRESSDAEHLEPGPGPVLDFWGARVESVERPWAPPSLPLAFLTLPDLAPLESSNSGDRQGLPSDLDFEVASGIMGTRWADPVVRVKIDSLEVTAFDETGGLRGRTAP